MEYVVLARKLRPMRFAELIGQETVGRILRNAIVQNRVAHAFLFAGSRGVGKTSAARILTKALNCLQLDQGEPCNTCENCTEINANASQDVYEIDAASNRGIDNIRELRDNANYQPAKCPYKVYIIDEAHMLTMESFNALLKTLEEPPEHVKFILATTSPHKIPDTIQSRCQRFDFPRIPLRVMSDYLHEVIGKEGVTLSRGAIDGISRNAAGGMRDALTAVDQVVAFAGNAPSDEEVRSILGLMDNREVFELLDALLTGSLDTALAAFAAIIERGHDLNALLAALLKEIKDLSLFVTMREASTYFQDHLPEEMEFYGRHAPRMTADVLQQLFALFLDLEAQLKRSAQTRACFEMTLAKACHVESLVGVPELLSRVRGLLGQGGATRAHSLPPAQPVATEAPRVPDQPPPEQAAPAPADQGTAARQRETETSGPIPADAPTDGEEPHPAPDLNVPAKPSAAAAAEVEPAPSVESPQPHAPQAEPVTDAATTATVAESAPPLPRESETPAAPTETGHSGTEPQSEPAPPGGATDTLQDEPRDAGLDASANVAADTTANAAAAHVAKAASPELEPRKDSETDAVESGELPPMPEFAWCDDERYAEFIAAVTGIGGKLAADLRRTEVTDITQNEVFLTPPSAAESFADTDLAKLAPALYETFGETFELVVNDDTINYARPEYTVSGRTRLAKLHHDANEREQALGDEQVARVKQAFPRATITDVRLRESTAGDNEDV